MRLEGALLLGIEVTLDERLDGLTVGLAVHDLAPCFADSGRWLPEKLPDAQARLVHLRLRRALGDAEDAADFVMIEAFHVMEQERGARAFRQRLDGPLEIEPVHRDPRFVGGVTDPVVQHVRRLILTRRLAPQPVQADVHPQAVQPRPERRVAAERVQLPVGGEENLLQQVVRVRGVPHHPEGQIVQPGRILPVDVLEGVELSAPASRDQFGLGRSPCVRHKVRRVLVMKALPAALGIVYPQGYERGNPSVRLTIR